MHEIQTYIFIDTCSLLFSCWSGKEDTSGNIKYDKNKEQTFWNHDLRNLLKKGRVVIPVRNYEELKKHAKNNKKPGLAKRSEYVLSAIDDLIGKKYFQLVGDNNDPFADAIILSAALKFRTNKNLIFITNDKKLSHDLISIKNFQSVEARNGQFFTVYFIGNRGNLINCEKV